MQLLLGRYLHWAHGNILGAGPACRDGQLMNPIFKIYLKDGRIAAVHTSSRQHNILYLGLDIGPLILHTNSRQGKNAPEILLEFPSEKNLGY
jgi:hypothetical protein